MNIGPDWLIARTYRARIPACKSSDPASHNFAGNEALCSFDYFGPMTETVLLGNVAYRAGKKLELDGENLLATNCSGRTNSFDG